MVKTYEQILYDAKLDAMFAGHVHAYERSHRVFQGAVDKCGATYINIGAWPTFVYPVQPASAAAGSAMVAVQLVVTGTGCASRVLYLYIL